VTGLALKGTVQTVENDDVKLDLDIDYGGGASQLYKYATDYSPESHTGWYVMPEVGDTVFLIMPSENEKDAHASSSMRQSATGKTGDPQTKFLRTPFGKEVKLNDKEVLITGKDDETFIKINEDDGIQIITSKPILIDSDETINIHSIGTTMIYSEDDMTIKTDKNLIISADESINMSCGDNIIDIKPAEGIKATTDTDINMFSTGKTNIESVDEMAIVTSSDMLISSDQNLTETGKATIALNNVVHSINMDLAKGISIVSLTHLNMLANQMASLLGILCLSLTSAVNLGISAPIVANSGKAAITMKGGAGSINLTPAGVNIGGPIIKEN
jgi:hypothetical protein